MEEGRTYFEYAFALLYKAEDQAGATHEAGAATTIINMRKTQVDDFSDLKISARLGEVCFTTAREYDRALYGCSWRNASSTSANKTDESLKDMDTRLQKSITQLNQTVQTLTTDFETVRVSQTYLTNEVSRIRSGEDANNFFTMDNMHDEDKVRVASIHLYDKALAWHIQFVKIYRETMTWELYESEIHRRFRACYEDPMEEIKNLKQTGIVPDYQDKLEALMSRMELNEQHAISFFMGGL
ncbi:reverse transcriptase [Tanacetum coccineum]